MDINSSKFYLFDGWDTAETVKFSDLEGKTIVEIQKTNENSFLYIKCSDDSEYLMYHQQDCCEGVYLDDIVGDLDILLNSPILNAYDTSEEGSDDDGTYTWTFYNISNKNGSVTLKWFGSSNGYYSEDVTVRKLKK